MDSEQNWEMIPPVVSPLDLQREEQQWRHFDNSVSAVSFGFVATAILISMFLVMAIFERFLRSRSLPPIPRARTDLETQIVFDDKPQYPSPKMTIYAKGVSVLMPGEETPTFIAHLVPVPCPPEHSLRPPRPHYEQHI